jgi:hypothetical protein
LVAAQAIAAGIFGNNAAQVAHLNIRHVILIEAFTPASILASLIVLITGFACFGNFILNSSVFFSFISRKGSYSVATQAMI